MAAPETAEEKLAKMEKILDFLTRKRKSLGRKQKQLSICIGRASGMVLDNFLKEEEENDKKLVECRSKEEWARHMVNLFKKACVCDEEGNLVHRPFGVLAALKFK